MKRLISSVLITFLLMNCMCVTISATDVIEGPVSIKDEYIKNFVNDTPPENLFRVAGDDRRFILLDTDLSNESSAFYVLSNELYGTAFFDTSEGAGKPYNSISNPSSGQKFDPSSQTNIANWLNGEFKNSGNIYNGTTYKLPQSIIDNIDINHVWRTECGDDTTNCSQNLNGGNKYFDVSTGISLMSMNEFEKYSGKYGVLDKTQDTLNGGNGNGWWLRTCNRGGTTVLRHVSANPGKIGAWDNGAVKTNRRLGVRPQFYLNKNFFKSVKIDAFNVGKNVKKAILSTCTESELSNLGYTKMEIESLKDVSVNSDNEIRISRDSTLSSIDKAPIVKVRIGNMNKGTSTYTIKYGATGTSDKEVKFDMKYLEIIEKDCVFDFAKEGIYTTNIEIKCNDNVVANFSPKVSFIKSNATNNNFDFSSKGVATHFSFGNTESKDIDYLKASGIKTVRDEILWKSVEKAFGVYDFGFSDTYINQLSQNGIEFIAVLGYENPLYCEGAPKEERAIAGFAKYAAETAKHYPMIKTFEVWNEPDLKSFWGREPSPAEYVALVKATSEAIRKVRPDAMIYGGVTTCTSFDYMNEIMNLGMYDYVEGVSYHPYVWPQTADDGKLEKLMDSHTAIVNENGGFKNIGISETGWPTHVGKDGSGEQKQAVQIVKELVISDEKAIDYNTIYDFRNDGTDESNVEHNFGIIHKDFMPKLAYFAFKNFNDIMSGAKYYGKIRLSDYATGYVYNKQGKPVVVAWGRNENNPIATTSGVSGINVYGDSVACNFVGTEPIYLIGMETSVLIEAASSNAVKSYEKFKALISPKLSSNASTKNIGQMINTQINLLESIESIKIADSKAVLDLLEQNQVIGERIIDGYYKNENGLSINEVSLALSILADGSLCIADLYSISQGASGTLKHTSETAIKKAEKTIENLTSAQSIFARAMIKQAKEISTISAKLELNSTMPNMANSYDMVATNLAVWGEKIVNINAEGDFFNITIKNGKMNIVGDVGTSDKMVTLEIFKPG
ncbi:MAG: cellulase family glycosylhydrolase, partial [Oscillospiraceae bacterium]